MCRFFVCLGLMLGVGLVSGAEIVVSERTGAAIQRAIDSVSADGGGRVVLTNGVYESATLYLKSGVELHLASDAVLRGAATPEAYADVSDPGLGKAPERSKKAFLVCLNGTNVAITGSGTIDGQGPLFYDRNVPPGRQFKKPPHPRTRMVEFFNCRNVRFSGVTFLDSPGWTFWLRMCSDVSVDGISILGDQRMINNDGLHFDGCKRVHVKGATIRTGDDCVVFRANRGANGDSEVGEDLTVEDCTLDSACQAVRLGCPSDGIIQRGIFRRLKITGNNGILSYHPLRYLQRGDRGHCAMRDLLVEDCDIDVRGSAITFNIDAGVTLREFGNVTLRDLRLTANQPILLKGNAETPLVNMTLERITGRIAASEPLVTRNVKGLVLKDVTLTSGNDKPAPFTWNWQSDSWECER